MKKNVKIGIGIVVLILAIGFASVTTNLIINNNAKLGFNASDFDIYFSSAIPENDGTATIDSTTKKTITYSTKTLTKVGDQAVLDYVVTNASTMYDARCTVTFTIDSGATEYVTIEKTGFVEDASTVVNAQSNKQGRVLITLKKGSMEPLTIHFTITLTFEPVGRTEEEEPGQVTPSDENPTNPPCVPSGYYGLKCSCDGTTYIAWQDGPYRDINGVAMNKDRVRDINYPPANTYICGCKSGQSGYVVNTGILLESECPVEEPEPDENSIALLRVDNKATARGDNIFDLDVPGFDDETGNNYRTGVTLDVYTQYHNADIEIVELDGFNERYSSELKAWYVEDGNVITNADITYLGVDDKKYSYQLDFRSPTSSDINADGQDYYLKIILKSKVYSNIVYYTGYLHLDVQYSSSTKYDENYDPSNWEDPVDHRYPYHQGVKPWATWFMNEGRSNLCWDAYACV